MKELRRRFWTLLLTGKYQICNLKLPELLEGIKPLVLRGLTFADLESCVSLANGATKLVIYYLFLKLSSAKTDF